MINKTWCIHIKEYYLGKKKKKYSENMSNSGGDKTKCGISINDCHWFQMKQMWADI